MQATTLASTRSPTARSTCLLRASQLPRRHYQSALRAYSGILLHTFGGQFCVLSAEHIDTSLSLLLSTRYFCAGSLWHIKQLSASKMVPNGKFSYIYGMQISMNIKFPGYWLIWNDCKDARAFFHFFSCFAVDLHCESTICLNTAVNFCLNQR